MLSDCVAVPTAAAKVSACHAVVEMDSWDTSKRHLARGGKLALRCSDVAQRWARDLEDELPGGRGGQGPPRSRQRVHLLQPHGTGVDAGRGERRGARGVAGSVTQLWESQSPRRCGASGDAE